MPTCMLDVQSLNKIIKNHYILKDINLHLKQGEILAVIGRNGAGKTSFLRVLCGFVSPTSGNVYLNGHSLLKENFLPLRKLGCLIEEPSFHDYLTGYQNLKLTAILLGLPLARIDEVLEIVNLEDARDKKLKVFSLGMRQRLGIAHAILGNPPLLIFDEPTNGLDPQGIIDMRKLILNLKGLGFTILFASHLLTEVEQICDRIAFMNNGRIVKEGTMTELLHENEQNRYVYELEVEPELTKDQWKSLFSNHLSVSVLPNGRIKTKLLDDSLSNVIQNLVTHGYCVQDIKHCNQSLEELFLLISEGEIA
jgi:ABC-type multidrug transport system ATPase subunit